MDIEVTSRGPVPERTKLLARKEISRLEGQAKGPLMGARVVLIQEENPRIPFPARAEGEVTIAGRPVRARAAAAAMDAAVDELAERLRRRLHGQVDRLLTRRREPAESPPGEWRHGSQPTARPERSFRPPGERRIERTKSFGMEPMTAERAALELDALDHDFFLFRDTDTGSDGVLYRRDDGHLAVIDVPGVAVPEGAGPARERSRISEPIDLRTAVREMDELGHRFLFFVNADSGRGNVIYLRYDGHYGLIEPAP